VFAYFALAAFALFVTTLLPYVMHMSGYFIWWAHWGWNIFVYRAWQLYRCYSDSLARKLFRYSIFYLAWLFALLLLDHWV